MGGNLPQNEEGHFMLDPGEGWESVGGQEELGKRVKAIWAR